MNRNGRLRVRAIPTRTLDSATIDAMWRLYEEHYDHVDRATFDRDLAEKTLVFLGTDAGSGAVVGFSTALFYRRRHAGRSVGVYFSGDTIIHPRYWGQTALHRCVIATLVRWKLRHPLTPLYWYLICSGYRTYLTLVRNFPEHWPHHERAMRTWEHGLLHALSRGRYGEAYDADRGVISFGATQPMLKTVVATLTHGALALPGVRFFTHVNPGHARGDELAMIARVNARAVGGMALKWLRRALSRRSRGAPVPVAGFPRPTM